MLHDLKHQRTPLQVPPQLCNFFLSKARPCWFASCITNCRSHLLLHNSPVDNNLCDHFQFSVALFFWFWFFFLEIQEISSGLALQACMRHSHQDPRSFSVITLSYFKVREKLPLGQVPLGTIHTSFFYNASTFPHAFTACPHSACFHSVSLAAVAHLSPAPTTTYVSWIQSYSSSKNSGKTLKLQKENMLFHPSWAERRPCSSSGICSSQELQ